MSKVAATLDAQLQEGTLDPLICNALCQRLSVLIESIDEWHNNNRRMVEPREQHLEFPSFVTLLRTEEKEELSAFLADDNTAAVDLVMSIKERISRQSNNDLSAFSDLIESYDFPEALSYFERLCHENQVNLNSDLSP